MHGYRTIADIMTALNPFTGAFYREALQMSRMTREMFCLMEGRHVHPSTLYPGGVGTVPTIQLFTDYLVRLMKYVEFMKKVVPLHDDLFDFFYEALPGYEEVGQRRVLLGCWGSFNDPDVCDYTYKNMTNWGRAMFVTPGVVVDGKLVTTDLVDINLNIRILLGSSYYDEWKNQRNVRQDRSAGQSGGQEPSLEPDHDPAAAEARLRRQVHLGDVAALVRQADRRSSGAGHRRRPDRPPVGDGAGRTGGHRLHQGDRHSVKMYLPKTTSLPEVEFEWKIPKWSNAIERDRARTYFQVYAACCALHFMEKAHGRTARRPHQNLDRIQGAGRSHRLRLPRSGARRALASRGDSKKARSRTTILIRRRPGMPIRATFMARRVRTRMRCRTRRSSKRTVPTSSRASTSCARCGASIRACRAACTCIWGTAKCWRRTIPRCSAFNPRVLNRSC